MVDLKNVHTAGLTTIWSIHGRVRTQKGNGTSNFKSSKKFHADAQDFFNVQAHFDFQRTYFNILGWKEASTCFRNNDFLYHAWWYSPFLKITHWYKSVLVNAIRTCDLLQSAWQCPSLPQASFFYHLIFIQINKY